MPTFLSCGSENRRLWEGFGTHFFRMSHILRNLESSSGGIIGHSGKGLLQVSYRFAPPARNRRLRFGCVGKRRDTFVISRNRRLEIRPRAENHK